MITVGGTFSSVTGRLVVPSTGAWFVEVDFDLDGRSEPSGRTMVEIGGRTLRGTYDAKASGRIGEKYRARIVAGGNGWSRELPALGFHNDAGVLAANVISTTAASVGETIGTTLSTRLAVDYDRAAGPASRVLAGVPWFVDFDGVTQVTTRATVANPAEADVLSWDPLTKVARIASADVIVPGTKLEDSRFGTVYVREVEQVFTSEGATALAWCESSPSSSPNRIAAALALIAREAVRPTYLAPHRYRVLSQSIADGRLTLQVVKKGAVPEKLEAISPWHGISGASEKFTPGAVVLVEFVEGNPELPIVRSYADGSPLELELSATVQASIDAPRVAMGLGTYPVALAPPVVSALSAILAYVSAVVSGLSGVAPALAAAVAAPASSATSAVSAATAGAPSTRTFSD